ncbi:hypothetical protein GCM10010435_87320 [Winogradskya consettensis]|uniref:Uncharacterized protein n=1 Tax=Winogradskya consettensis TaxID=113560 RepID=A0A919SY58_9ACTN|nr:DUF6228 family protein [Actinoplanes consettensis]GIM80851.1 hypothetical protein Aco04nite_73110 [Actinoplanes consettensis]
MSEWFVLGRPDAMRWVVHPPHDSYGDGYIFSAAMELHDEGLTATTVAQIDGVSGDIAMLLPAFVEKLAADWQGWEGVRRWRALDGAAALDARHDGRALVTLGVTLRAADPRGASGWSARVEFGLEPGEEMRRFAQAVSFPGPPSSR